MTDLCNKVCIITGAGKGIGYSAARLFHKLGCKLALISRSESDLQELSKELNSNEADIFWMAGDASCEKDVQSFVNQAYCKFGKIDVLFNNAGIRFRKKFTDITYEQWQNVMNVNVGSTFLMCKEVAPYMIEQKKGKVINMASIIGTNGLAELTGYSASKGAIISMSKSLAIEWAPYNINVNILAPGFCETSYAENFKKNNKLYDFTLERIPMRRWGHAEDVANTAAFLASEVSDYISGEVIHIDGGWNAW